MSVNAASGNHGRGKHQNKPCVESPLAPPIVLQKKAVILIHFSQMFREVSIDVSLSSINSNLKDVSNPPA